MTSPVDRQIDCTASYPAPPETEPFPPFPVDEAQPEAEPAPAPDTVERRESQDSDGRAAQVAASATETPRSRARPARLWKACRPGGNEVNDSGIDSSTDSDTCRRSSAPMAFKPLQYNAVSPNELQPPPPSAAEGLCAAPPGKSDCTASELTLIGNLETQKNAMEPENVSQEPLPDVPAAASEPQQYRRLTLYQGQGSPAIWEEAQTYCKQAMELVREKSKEPTTQKTTDKETLL